MEKYFRTEAGERINLIDHILQEIDKNQDLRIYIGTDSQDKDGKTKYATCVVFRYGKRGAHYVSQRDEGVRIKDTFTRLYGEAVRTIETAELIKESLPSISIEALEFDYNNEKRWFSNRVISAVNGWVKGLQYRAVFKNRGEDMMIASKAADRVCRK